MAYLTYLVEELGPRASATQEELAGAEYLASEFESFGYSVELQPFTIRTPSAEVSDLDFDGPDFFEVSDAIPLVSSQEGTASGSLVAIGLAGEGDLPQDGLAGKIALVQRGIITFEEKVTRAAEAGAIAVIIYNNAPGNFRAFLATQASIPAVAISRRDGERIEELLEAGPVSGSVSVKSTTQTSQNVVATKLGAGADAENRMVVFGGHYDTVPNNSGANDNSSGTALVLTLARELANEDLPFTIRMIGFGSEELGLRGSLHYVASLTQFEQESIIAMLNFDAVGSGRQAGILGDIELTDLALKQADELRISAQATAGLTGGGTDHISFSQAGIPVLMFFGPDFSRIHTTRDTLEFVNPRVLGDAAAIALAVVRSPDFPTVLD